MLNRAFRKLLTLSPDAVSQAAPPVVLQHMVMAVTRKATDSVAMVNAAKSRRSFGPRTTATRDGLCLFALKTFQR